MAISIRNSDLVLKYDDADVRAILNKYDDYLEALYDDEYSFHRDAVKKAVGFLLLERYATTEDLANENYDANPFIKDRYATKAEFISHIPLAKQKACSLDLATGTGKSFLMFGIAQVMLCEEAVDKVLVLCPSLTIEEGLTEKFNELNTRPTLTDILRSINPKYVQPEIKNANDTILSNDICIENIHATYQRTGSSIADSFKNDGERVLVMNDEAHHIFTGEADAPAKKWIEFLKDPEYNFKYLVQVTGTPYYGSDNNEYFNDVVYRFGIKNAVERGIIKKVDYKTFDEYKNDKGFQQSWAVHKSNIEKYGDYVKPISIVICASIADAIVQWNELVECLMDKEGISYEDACKKAIWVTSGTPAKDSVGGRRIAPVLAKDPAERSWETIRKDNLKLLKTVDLPIEENPVEWIVSVAMLTEGWDVKNVFQVVPHEQKAFNSKLLISQVLGRGLRMPPSVKEALGAGEVLLKVNNHEKWTQEIQDLYNDVLEVENRLSWGFDERRKAYAFPLHNMTYEPVETTKETKKEQAKFSGNFGFNPQQKSAEYKAEFLHGTVSYVFEEKDTYSLDLAAANLYSYLKDKSAKVAKGFSKKGLKEAFQKELTDKGYGNDFLSKENYIKAQQAFGPIFRELGKEVPRVSAKPDALVEVEPSALTQTFSEESLKGHGCLFYTDESLDSYGADEKTLFHSYISIDESMAKIATEMVPGSPDLVALATKMAELDVLKKQLADHLVKVDDEDFKTPLNSVFVSYTPEIAFMKTLLLNINLVDSFLKSADKGFYSFPYYYKPETVAKTHSRGENFNPDFFLKLKDSSDLLVVETKKKEDDSQKNKAKFRQAKEHFDVINKKLEEKEIPERYYFKFLSDDGSDIAAFFSSIKSGEYKKWHSKLMNQLNAE